MRYNDLLLCYLFVSFEKLHVDIKICSCRVVIQILLTILIIGPYLSNILCTPSMDWLRNFDMTRSSIMAT